MARALQPEKEAAQLAVDQIEDERRKFLASRSNKKVELETTRLAAKRKHESDLAAQRLYNKTIKGESRKKFKEAVASAEPIDV